MRVFEHVAWDSEERESKGFVDAADGFSVQTEASG